MFIPKIAFEVNCILKYTFDLTWDPNVLKMAVQPLYSFTLVYRVKSRDMIFYYCCEIIPQGEHIRDNFHLPPFPPTHVNTQINNL